MSTQRERDDCKGFEQLQIIYKKKMRPSEKPRILTMHVIILNINPECKKEFGLYNILRKSFNLYGFVLDIRIPRQEKLDKGFFAFIDIAFLDIDNRDLLLGHVLCVNRKDNDGDPMAVLKIALFCRCRTREGFESEYKKKGYYDTIFLNNVIRRKQKVDISAKTIEFVEWWYGHRNSLC